PLEERLAGPPELPPPLPALVAVGRAAFSRRGRTGGRNVRGSMEGGRCGGRHDAQQQRQCRADIRANRHRLVRSMIAVDGMFDVLCRRVSLVGRCWLLLPVQSSAVDPYPTGSARVSVNRSWFMILSPGSFVSLVDPHPEVQAFGTITSRHGSWSTRSRRVPPVRGPGGPTSPVCL
ncbi:hypothetical protein THAOC_16788, partial [Thalassiosira oceanica]